MDRGEAVTPMGGAILGPWLESLARRADALGRGYEAEAAAARALGERLAEQRFHLAVLGQFKRGKSTLLNALLGEEVLPTGVVPLTAIPTFLRPGPSRRLVVHYSNGEPVEERTLADAATLRATLADFVTEKENPRNERGVSFVEVFHFAPLLAAGVVLIDTPGIGSTHQHNTEMTLNFLEQCDAALVLLSADLPITEVEVEFCRVAARRIPRLLFVLNKVDYLNSAEREEAIAFLREVLSKELGVDGGEPVFALSAREGLAARREGSLRAWRKSGMERLEERLNFFLQREKQKALSQALGLRAQDLLSRVTLKVELALRSMQMPLEQLERRSALFAERLAEAERERLAAQDLLEGDRRRLLATLEEQADRLREDARGHLGRVLDQALASASPKNLDEEWVRRAIEAAIPGYFEQALGRLSREFKEQVRRVFAPHLQRAEELVDAVRRHAAEIFEIDLAPRQARIEFDPGGKAYWVTHKWRSSLSPLPPGAVDRLLPGPVRRRRIEQRFQTSLEGMVLHNVENLRWQTRQSLDQAFRRFARQLDERVEEVIAATRGAIETSARLRRERADAAAAETARLAEALDDLSRLDRAFGRDDSASE